MRAGLSGLLTVVSDGLERHRSRLDQALGALAGPPHSLAPDPQAPLQQQPTPGLPTGHRPHDSREALLESLTNVLLAYRHDCGHYPDLIQPRLYSEKINHAKFFAAIKIPENGNKLLTASFLVTADG